MALRALVIIPTYNEKDNVRGIVEAALAQGPNVDVLVVDDNSPDGTSGLVEEMGKSQPRVHLLHRSGKLGLGTAYIAGFKWGLSRGYEFLIEMDADFSHDPKEIPNLLKTMSVADLALGSRYINGVRVVNWPLSRLVLSKGASFYVRLITGLPVMDPTGGFKCFHRRVLESMELDGVRSNGYAFQVEMTHKAWMKGFRIAEIPITFTDRYAGQSKMSGKIVREALWMTWALAFAHGLRRSPPKRSGAP
ncbi:MAG TPA: polyprenol monophosphomannose synthase [Verrucomicrobiae bacterium]|nr:polyprenol monophosphomannose synthase [Verrucomicrobiae bacterium]